MQDSALAGRMAGRGGATRYKTLCFASVLALALSAALIAGSLTAVTPAGASALVPITITGTGFNATASSNGVLFVYPDGTTKTAVAQAVSALNTTTGRRTLTVRCRSTTPSVEQR